MNITEYGYYVHIFAFKCSVWKIYYASKQKNNVIFVLIRFRELKVVGMMNRISRTNKTNHLKSHTKPHKTTQIPKIRLIIKICVSH